MPTSQLYTKSKVPRVLLVLLSEFETIWENRSEQTPKIALNTAETKVPQLYFIIILEPQIPFRFVLQLAVSKLFASFYFPISHNLKFPSFTFSFFFNFKFQVPRINFYVDYHREHV